MLTKREMFIGAAATGLLALSLLGWNHSSPAAAQGPGPGRMMGGGASVAASGDYVYVVRGGTLYQMKSADLSIAAQKDLPAPAPPAAPAEKAP